MEQNPSQEGNKCSVSQTVPRILIIKANEMHYSSSLFW